MGIGIFIIAVLIGLTALLRIIGNLIMISGTKLANSTTAEGDQVQTNNDLKVAAKAKLKKNAIIFVIAVVVYLVAVYGFDFKW